MFKLSSEGLARFCVRFPWLWVFLVLLTVLPAGYFCSRLTIQSDFKRLLPADKPSVITLNKILERVGGIGYLAIGVESEDYKASERFIDDLVAELKKLPKEYVRHIEYNSKDVRKFYEKNKYLYIDLEDLKTIDRRLARKIRHEKLNNNPLYFALEEDKADFDVSDIEAKYKGKTSKYDKYIDGYFFSQDRKLAAVLVQPSGSTTGTAFAKKLIRKIQGVVDELRPTTYHPTLRVSFGGKYQRILREYDQLIRDVLETLGLCLILVAVVIFLYFFRIRAIWLLTTSLVIGATWTFALTQIHIGYLNSQTAFLGSIIVGNGVNSGIFFLARYLEERRLGRMIAQALGVAYRTTWLGTFTAAITTSAAFGALSFSQIKGFSQFGFIGGIGMMLCWLAAYTILPPLLVISERAYPIVKKGRLVSKQWEFVFYPVGSLVAHSPKLIAGFGIFIAAASLGLAIRFLPDSLEYDFSKLKNKQKKTEVAGQSLDNRVRRIFDQNLAPAVILLDDEKQAEYVCDAVMQRESSYPVHERTIEHCTTLRSYLPEEQREKLKVLRRIRHRLNDDAIKLVQPKYRKEIDQFRREVKSIKKVRLKNLPPSIKRNYQELDGTVGRVVYVYPHPKARLSDGKRLMQFADMLSEVRLKDGSVVRMSGESAIFADLLRAVERDGPIATLLSFIAVSLLIILNFRRKRPIIYVLGGLLSGISILFGLQSIMEIRLNFFNFIALPVTFGIGVDYGVNLLQRYRFEGRGSMRRVLGTVGGTIFLCSLTTIIGYGTLTTATNQALASFGWLALLGEFACIFASIVIMPALLHSFDRKHQTLPEPFTEKRQP